MQVASTLRLILFACVCVAITAAYGQDRHHFNISAGAGVSMPTADATSNLNTGWNLDFRGGLDVTSGFLADLDFSFNHWGLSNAALSNFGQPGGYVDVWSISFVPVVRLAPHHFIDPYILGGGGIYHRNLSLTQPATVQTIFCDPFFGYCYPALVGVNQVVASFSTFKPGFDLGGGVDFRVGSGLRLFAEARYNEMFTTHGPNLSYVPVTFGVRW